MSKKTNKKDDLKSTPDEMIKAWIVASVEEFERRKRSERAKVGKKSRAKFGMRPAGQTESRK
jgi:DNA invertase Pin-like site-specific DNA recombinase